MPRKNEKFCYRTPTFPKTGYLCVTFVVNQDNINLIYPLETFYHTIPDLIAGLRKLHDHISKTINGRVLGCIIFHLKFDHSFPLKKEFWTSPGNFVPFEFGHKIRRYNNFLDQPFELFHLAVVPHDYQSKTKTWNFACWLPLLLTTSTADVEALIRGSDQYVNPTADTMAFYSITRSQGYDFETGEFTNPDNSTVRSPVEC